jgi:hypothetical protein
MKVLILAQNLVEAATNGKKKKTIEIVRITEVSISNLIISIHEYILTILSLFFFFNYYWNYVDFNYLKKYRAYIVAQVRF